MNNRRGIFYLIVFGGILLLGAGCAATGSLDVDYSAVSQLSNTGNLEVDVICNSAEEEKERANIEQAVVSHLQKLGVFKNVYGQANSTGYNSDVRLEVTVTSIKRVSKSARWWLGSMAGRGKIEASIDIFDLHTKMKVARAKVFGETSGGTAFAGTTGEAIDKLAESIEGIFRNKVFSTPVDTGSEVKNAVPSMQTLKAVNENMPQN